MKYGPCIVGVGGPRNSHGFLEMDAAVMNGRHLQFGAVTALKGSVEVFFYIIRTVDFHI